MTAHETSNSKPEVKPRRALLVGGGCVGLVALSCLCLGGGFFGAGAVRTSALEDDLGAFLAATRSGQAPYAMMSEDYRAARSPRDFADAFADCGMLRRYTDYELRETWVAGPLPQSNLVFVRLDPGQFESVELNILMVSEADGWRVGSISGSGCFVRRPESAY